MNELHLLNPLFQNQIMELEREVEHGTIFVCIQVPIISLHWERSWERSWGTHGHKIFRLVTIDGIRCKNMVWEDFPSRIYRFSSFKCFNKPFEGERFPQVYVNEKRIHSDE